MDKPFTPLTFSTIIGILISYYFETSLALLITLIGVTSLCYISNLIRNRSNDINIFILFLLLAMLITTSGKESKLINYINQRLDFTGKVHEVISSSENESRYVVKISKEEDGKYIREKIILNVIGDKQIKLGAKIEFNGILNIPLKNTNPKLFNYKQYLLTENIYTTMTVKDYSVNIKVDPISLRYVMKDKFTKDVTTLFTKYLNKDNSSLMLSMILGDSSYLDEENLIKYRELGLAHVLAVSGLHIGIIISFLIYIFSRLGIPRKYNVLFTLIIIWLYGYLIGYPPSTLRASLMFSILLYSKLIHEPYDTINTLLFSMVLCLFLNPFWIFSIGFQLSYLATLSIVILYPRIMDLFYPYEGVTMRALGTLLAANIGLLPIQGYYFNRISTLSMLSNIVAIPILSFSLIIGFLMIILNYTIPIFNISLGILLNLLLNLESMILNFIEKIPVNTIKIFSPDLYSIIFYFLIISIVFKLINLNKLTIDIKKTIIYYCIILILVNTLIISFDNSIEVHFIDVGQGDSILIRSKRADYLMDTGGTLFDGFDVGSKITLPYLEKLGINSLDGVIITHFDADHYQGLFAIMNNISIKNLFASYTPDEKLINKLNKNDIELRVINSNNQIILDENTNIKIIWPTNQDDLHSLSGNNKSLVSLLQYNKTNLLFTGDIESETEENLIGKINKDVDILKVAHHGSKTSTTESLLEIINPKYSIISVGRNNFYGHPHKEVIERLENNNSTIYRTDEMGLIKVVLNNDKIKILPYLNTSLHQSLGEYLWKNMFVVVIYLIYLLISYIMIKIYIE